ncbi:MAG: phospholipase [Gemmatimonadota bacterium]|nr:MAG: phospholipase [Gemmatimonadota bacterium]
MMGVADGMEMARRLGMSRRDFVRSGLGALAVSVLPGCGAEAPTEPPPVAGPRLTARPGEPILEPTIGTSSLGLGTTRDGLLHVPEGYDENTPAPLFVALHGAGGSATNWASYPGRADARGMVLLIPDSRAFTWDLIRGGFGPDVEFLNQALAHTFDRCRIDPARIALGGFSDGASYALSLGVSNGDLFSHLIGYSPGFIQPSDPIVGKPPVFVSHGSQDSVLPVSTTRNVIVPTLRENGYDVTYVEFDGGHEVPAVISETALDWFLGVG